MNINWQNLRSWNGSQNAAFEELCCQLARYEKVPPSSTFIRKAPPDAGVECYWKLPNGDEWGWQAKYFTSIPGPGQWTQLDESIKKALEKHPKLTRYFICLPIDRQDPRIDKQEWFMERWDDHVKKWKGWAEDKGMSVEFEYWGEHEIGERLSREENRGRYFFWFNKEMFSNQWFKERVDEAISDAGPRYTPELNVELPLAQIFDYLGLTETFYNNIRVLYGEIKREYRRALTKNAEEASKDDFNEVSDSITSLLKAIKEIKDTESFAIDLGRIIELAHKSENLSWRFYRKLQEIDKEKVNEKQRKENTKHIKQDSQRRYEYERHHLHKTINKLWELSNYVQCDEALLTNIPALLLAGKAGTGKTHLFCDVAKQRVDSNIPAILLLGEKFINQEPWSQIISHMGLTRGRDEFLGALEAAAQAAGQKAIIFIDALNEGEGKYLWYKYIGGILTTLSRYPWISIAFSVRNSYEDLVIPEGLIQKRIIRKEHFGFVNYEYQATKIFFDYYNIELPKVPLLVPEFQNPQFLKLFCKGLNNKGISEIPKGLKGITAIYDLFIKSVNEKLSKPEHLNLDKKSHIVQKAINKIAEMMAVKKIYWLPRDEVKVALNTMLPRNGYEDTLFRHLISEGLLTEDRFLIGDDEWHEGIHFSYERFSDHLIAEHLLEKHLNPNNPSDSFLPDKSLGSLLKDEWECRRNRGLIEAFSIQIPERIKKELAETAPSCADYQSVREAFVESLIWRAPNAITDATLKYINENVVRYEDTHDQFLNVLLTVASNPEHPYNADFLHGHLMKFDLAERDSWWSLYLHYQYGGQGTIDSLIDWAWSTEDKSHISSNSIRLAGIALSWFLTTSNRYLRDRATKALVSLFTSRINVLRQMMSIFMNINDPYVLERLFAVAYGCAMRSLDTKAIGELAKDVYEWVFKDGCPPTDILLRDYARGVIELALYLGIDLDIDLNKIRPPYSSEWPSEIPSEEEAEKYGKWEEGMADGEWSRVSIYSSVMSHGDFARYIIGTNWSRFDWSSRRLNEPKEPSQKEIYENFIDSLTPRQKRAWERYHDSKFRITFELVLEKAQKPVESKDELIDDKLEKDIMEKENAFRKTLGKKKLQQFNDQILPYLNSSSFNRDEYPFDLSIAQRWILKKVFDLGWNVERFGKFDRNIEYMRDHREAHKAERMGKKYQWIAYHEFLARVADNFEFKGDPISDSEEQYDGPWQIIHLRDIDPSCLLVKTEREGWGPHANTWWFPSSYDAWETEPEDKKWLNDSKDIPNPLELIDVINQVESSRWLVLEAHYSWEQPTPPEEERFEIPRREIWYMLKSYIVRKADMDELYRWAIEQNFEGRWMPESQDIYRVFPGEFFWAPAFEYHNLSYHENDGWTRGMSDRLPKEVLVSAIEYVQESTSYDCSIDDTIKIYLPTKWIVDNMGLSWNGKEGQFYNDQDELIAFDPSINKKGPGALLINKEAFLKFLNEKGYDVLWTVLGEKQIIGGRMASEDWKGRLEINGTCKIREGKIEGKINTRFISR